MSVLRRSAIVLQFLAVFLLPAGYFAQSQASPRVAGTFTSLHFVEEAGDLVGEELVIENTSRGYRGTMQFAEGVPTKRFPVQIAVKGNDVAFDVKGAGAYDGHFEGVVEAESVHGHFEFARGGTQELILKRGRSYWAQAPTD